MQVFWDGEQEWYEGEVVGYSASSGRHTVQYDDGDLQHELIPGIPHRCAPPEPRSCRNQLFSANMTGPACGQVWPEMNIAGRAMDNNPPSNVRARCFTR